MDPQQFSPRRVKELLIYVVIPGVVANAVFAVLLFIFKHINIATMVGIAAAIGGLGIGWIIWGRHRRSLTRISVSVWFLVVFGVLAFVSGTLISQGRISLRVPGTLIKTPTLVLNIRILDPIPPADSRGGPDSRGDISGRVEGIGDLSECAVVLYARTGYTWYVQPESAIAITDIGPHGEWNNWTHLGSEYAALLVKKPYTPSPALAALPVVSGNILAITSVKGSKR